MSASVARRLSIRGRVQGVGYRDAMIGVALRHGVHGWVRNRRDGSVEAFVQGPQHAVDRVVAWAQRGPPASRVAAVDVADAGIDPALGTFAMMPTT